MKVIAIMGILICLFAIAMTNAHGMSIFSGGFVADNRPHSIYYLKLTQTKESVSGSLMLVVPNKKGSTQSTTRQITGTTDGRFITLIADQLFGNSIITGMKEGKSIMLAFPNDSGSFSNVAFNPTSDAEYNLTLKQWQGELGLIQAERDSIDHEHRHLKGLSETLANNIRAYKSTTIKEEIEHIKSILNDEMHSYKVLEMQFAEMKHNASVKPMSCYQAHGIVGYDFNGTLMYQYDGVLGYHHNQYTMAANLLERKLSNVDRFIEETNQFVKEFEQSIKNRKHPLPSLSVLPGDEIHTINQYRILADSARKEINDIKINQLDISNKSKMLMTDAEALFNKTVSLVQCD